MARGRTPIVTVLTALLVLGSVLPGFAELKQIGQRDFDGKLTPGTALMQGAMNDPRSAKGWDPRERKFFSSTVMDWQPGHTVVINMGSWDLYSEALIFAPSGELLASSTQDSSLSAPQSDGSRWVTVQYSVPEGRRFTRHTVVFTTRYTDKAGSYAARVTVYGDDDGGGGGGGGGGGSNVSPVPCQCPPGSVPTTAPPTGPRPPGGFNTPAGPTTCYWTQGPNITRQVAPKVPPGCIP